MDSENRIELNINLSAENATEEDIDLMTRRLLFELKETDVDTAKLAKGEPAPSGTKSVDPVTTGAIAITVLPAVLPKIIDLVQAWVARGQGRTVKFKGKGIEFEGSAEELRELLVTLDKGKKKK